jgi:hypothetical protein
MRLKIKSKCLRNEGHRRERDTKQISHRLRTFNLLSNQIILSLFFGRFSNATYNILGI